MKIEKISNTQIKCTLVDSDLTSRDLQFSDLVFKREKAKVLFEDIMNEALDRFGFSAGDGPLMIEALPNGDDSVSLIFTKLPNDTALPSDLLAGLGQNTDTSINKSTKGNDDFFNPLIGAQNYKEGLDISERTPVKKRKTGFKKIAENSHLFSFVNLEEVMNTCEIFSSVYFDLSSLHLDKGNGLFILTLTRKDMTLEEFNRICNALSEFGVLELCNEITLAFLEEHCELIRKDDAMHTISNL